MQKLTKAQREALRLAESDKYGVVTLGIETGIPLRTGWALVGRGLMRTDETPHTLHSVKFFITEAGRSALIGNIKPISKKELAENEAYDRQQGS